MCSFTGEVKPTFEQDWNTFELYFENYKANQSQQNKEDLFEAIQTIQSYGDITELLKGVHDGHKDCKHVCAQAAIGCVRYLFMVEQCLGIYNGCMSICDPSEPPVPVPHH